MHLYAHKHSNRVPAWAILNLFLCLAGGPCKRKGSSEEIPKLVFLSLPLLGNDPRLC